MNLARIVEELLRAYPDLDGIQFDYIRYPDLYPHYGYTKVNMQRFTKASGIKIIDDDSAVLEGLETRSSDSHRQAPQPNLCGPAARICRFRDHRMQPALRAGVL